VNDSAPNEVNVKVTILQGSGVFDGCPEETQDLIEIGGLLRPNNVLRAVSSHDNKGLLDAQYPM
jgi:hypothetical protein